jgi:hypothetical protein
MSELWLDTKIWFRYWFQWPYNWKYALRRIRRNKKVCRNCFYYHGACRHIDPEIMELLRKRIEEDRLGIRPLPRIRLGENGRFNAEV